MLNSASPMSESEFFPLLHASQKKKMQSITVKWWQPRSQTQVQPRQSSHSADTDGDTDGERKFDQGQKDPVPSLTFTENSGNQCPAEEKAGCGTRSSGCGHCPHMSTTTAAIYRTGGFGAEAAPGDLSFRYKQ